MMYKWTTEGLVPLEKNNNAEKVRIGIYDVEDLQTLSRTFSLDSSILKQWNINPSPRYESRKDTGYISMSISPYDPGDDPAHRVLIIFRQNLLLIIGKDTRRIGEILTPASPEISVDSRYLFLHFMEKLILDDHNRLDKIEEDISDLEDSLLRGREDDVETVIDLRKQLLGWNKYYEGMLWVLDDLQENENDLLDDFCLRRFQIHSNRVDRIFHNVLHLKEYITQVGESYQTEMDLRLNNIMKIFTVITAVFLPLTLLVGWYGMNLKMPEFRWAMGYPFVATIAVIVVLICIIFFKRKKWF